MNGAVTGPLTSRPSPWPREHREHTDHTDHADHAGEVGEVGDADAGPATERSADAVSRDRESSDFWRAWEWPEPDGSLDAVPAVPAVPAGRAGARVDEHSDVAALLPDDLLDPDGDSDRWWSRRHGRERRSTAPTTGHGGRGGHGGRSGRSGRGGRSARRALVAVGSLAVLSGGFLAGVVVDRAVSADALDAARAAGPSGSGATFSGRVEADAFGTLAVVSSDGRRQAVRTSPGTEVVSMNLLTGDLPPGTPVQVRTRTGPDGTPEATSVAVTGGPTTTGSAAVTGP